MFAGGDSAGELKRDWILRARGGDILSAHGVAIDGGIIERRQVGGGQDFFGDDAAVGFHKGNRFRFRCWNGGEDFFHGLFELEHAERVEGRGLRVEKKVAMTNDEWTSNVLVERNNSQSEQRTGEDSR